MKGALVVREDGTRGAVVSEDASGQLVVEFEDGSNQRVPSESLLLQGDGSYRLPSSDIIIPVVAEELTIQKQQVARGKVRVTKRVESREEVVDTPVVREEVVVERVPVNRVIDDVDAVPTVREEAGV